MNSLVNKKQAFSFLARNPKILLVGSFSSWEGPLEESYARAFEILGAQIVRFDLGKRIDHYSCFGRVGRILNRFLSVEAWIRKANREVVLAVLEEKPDFVIISGQSPVQPGALAQIATMSNAKLILLWPDTLVNISTYIIMSLPLYDLVVSYGQQACSIFERLGARQAKWVPLAGDPELHPIVEELTTFVCDVSFVGNWRPERERVLSLLCTMPDIKFKIWGEVDWKRFAGKNSAIMRAWQGKGVFGKKFAQVVGSSKINLNIIDHTNFPSANMRFFEIPCVGGLQVCSLCPEMENKFKHGETIFYYRKLEELPDMIRSLLNNDSLRKQVAQKAHAMVLSEHTYKHRAQQILELLKR
jgi:hypothetical protein